MSLVIHSSDTRRQKSTTETHWTSDTKFRKHWAKGKWLRWRNNFRHPVANNRPYAVSNAGQMLTPELVVFSRDVKQYAAQRRKCNCSRSVDTKLSHASGCTFCSLYARTHACPEHFWLTMSIEKCNNYGQFVIRENVCLCCTTIERCAKDQNTINKEIE